MLRPSDLSGTSGTVKPDSEVISSSTNSFVSKALLSHEDFYNNNIIVSQEHGVCVRMDTNEVGFDFGSFQTQLRYCIDTIYTKDTYLEGIDVAAFECLLYGTQEAISGRIDAEIGGIRICQAIAKYPTNRKAIDIIYSGSLQFSDDKIEATMIPEDIGYIQKMFGEDYETNPVFAQMSTDFFHAYFWQHGIKYHGESRFLELINNKSRKELDTILKGLSGVVSIGKDITETMHDTVLNFETIETERFQNPSLKNEFPSLKENRKPAIRDGKIAPGGEMECIFPKAKSKQPIFDIILGIKGESGITVKGDVLPFEQVKKLEASSLIAADSMQFVDIDTSHPGKIRINAKEEFYISFDKQKRIILSKHKKFQGDISNINGSISLPKDETLFELEGTIESGYHIRGYDIMYSGELFGAIYAQNNVQVKSGGIVGGTIISEKGSIIIESGVRIQDGTRIEALNGTVTIQGDINRADIIADEIIVGGKATKSTLIARGVKLAENNGSRVIGENISVKSDNNTESEYLVLMYAGIDALKYNLEVLGKQVDGDKKIDGSKIEQFHQMLSDQRKLLVGNPNKDARIEIVAIPFLIDTKLGELLSINNHPDLLRLKRNDGLKHMIDFLKKNEGVLLNNRNIELGDAMPAIQNRLIDRSSIKQSTQHYTLYPRTKLEATVGDYKGFIWTYSDSGCSFVLMDKSALSIQLNSAIDVTISQKNISFSFFVTGVESDPKNRTSNIRVKGIYITRGIEKAINILATTLENEINHTRFS